MYAKADVAFPVGISIFRDRYRTRETVFLCRRDDNHATDPKHGEHAALSKTRDFHFSQFSNW